MLFYVEWWHLLLITLGLLFAGMMIWRTLHIQCVNKRIQRETKFRRQRNHYLARNVKYARY